jgi:lipopolysaccharide transport system permease protein
MAIQRLCFHYGVAGVLGPISWLTFGEHLVHYQPHGHDFLYTVIFSKIMRARLPGVDDTMGYGIFLCAGLLTWDFFSELLGRCPGIFIGQVNKLL